MPKQTRHPSVFRCLAQAHQFHTFKFTQAVKLRLESYLSISQSLKLSNRANVGYKVLIPLGTTLIIRSQIGVLCLFSTTVFGNASSAYLLALLTYINGACYHKT